MRIVLKWCRVLAAVMILPAMVGCVSAPLTGARNAFYGQNLQGAADLLENTDEVSNRDRLLLYMEKGMVLHHMGRYGESASELRKASVLMERQETLSVSRQTASMVTSDWVTAYKGEYAERLWVHTYLMMNYLMDYQYESALVEAKQAIKVLDAHAEPLSGDYFTRALVAMCFENLAEYNGAYIEYKKLAESLPDPGPVAAKLYSLARRLGFSDEAKFYKDRIPHSQPAGNGDRSGELVLFVGTGRGPVKEADNIVIPPSIRFSFPRYDSYNPFRPDITVLDAAGAARASMRISTNMDEVARASLKARATKVMAKETARAAVKEAIAQGVGGKNNELAEVLVRAVLFITEEADTRGWETLPAYLSLLRIPLAPGTHDIIIRVSDPGGRVILEEHLPAFQVDPGQVLYNSVRTYE